MSRAQARKPDWLQLSTPLFEASRPQQALIGRPAPDTTARVLEFPATALRQPTAASSRRLPPPSGSLLAAEPAYRSALSDLRAGSRPATAPATTSTSLPPAAPPRSRLDVLLQGRPGTAAAAAATTAAARPGSSRLDALLSSSRPVVAPATVRQPTLGAAKPSSRLDELLATRPSASVTKASLPSTRLDQLLSGHPPVRPATAALAASDQSTSRAAASGNCRQPQAAAPSLPGGARSLAAPAALSPVEEEPASASRTDRSGLEGAGSRAAASQGAAGAGARGGPAAATAAAEARPQAGHMPDLALQDRLRERIELAKAQIRQQLSPMFRLSEALLGAGQDPQRSAEALDAATGASANGFDLLARRPGSRGGSAGAGAGGGSGAATAAQDRPREPWGAQRGGPAGAAAEMGGQLQEEPGRALQPGAAAAAWDATAGASALLGSTDEVDSLVANARAAAARAQSALAELASPPRTQHQQHRQHATPRQHERPLEEAASVPAAGHRASAAAPRPAPPLPYAQLAVSAGVGGPAVVMHTERELQPPQQVLPPLDGAGAHVWVDQLRQRSEDLIRTECERLVASMHLLFDSVRAGLQQELAQQKEQGQRLRQHQPHQQQLRQRPEAGTGAVEILTGHSKLGAEAWYAESPQQALYAAASHQEKVDSVHSSAAHSCCLTGSSNANSEAGGVSWQSAEEVEGRLEQQGEEQMPPRGQIDSGSGDNSISAAFQFSPHGQQRGQQQQDGQQALQQGSIAADSSPPERQQQHKQLQQATGAGFAGFGSPIRVLPSPAKPAAGGGAPSRLRFAAPEGSSCEQAGEQPGSWPAGSSRRQQPALPPQDEQQQRTQHVGRTATQAASVGDPERPAADAGQVTPAVDASDWASGQGPPPTGLDPYLTARSVAAPASCAGSVGSDAFDSPRSPAAGSEGGGSGGGGTSGGGGALFRGPGPPGKGSLGRASAAEPPALPPAGAAGRKDLDSIVGRIRRLAAEMRLKQGVLAMPPTGSGALQGGGARPPAHDTPSGASQLLFTPAGGSSGGGRGSLRSGALYTASSVGHGSSSAAALRKPPR